jgi:hypothetical protein
MHHVKKVDWIDQSLQQRRVEHQTAAILPVPQAHPACKGV